MYFLFGIFLALCILFFFLQFFRRRHIICKVKKMELCKKVCLLNEILTPFGFCYELRQDIVTTMQDAWQRQFGYCSLFDSTALVFGMTFDCEPIFFYYEGRTYRIELWKGQYGINLGAEVGIYYAEGILSQEQLETAVFQSVSDEELLTMGITVYQNGQKLFDTMQEHWWLTGFRVGTFCEPESLTMKVSISFCNSAMLSCFVESLLRIGYSICNIKVCNCTVSFLFSIPHTRQPRLFRRLRAAFTQWKNRICQKLFLFITKPFCSTVDRLIYLYFFLPPCFRHMFVCRKSRSQKFCKRKIYKKYGYKRGGRKHEL